MMISMWVQYFNNISFNLTNYNHSFLKQFLTRRLKIGEKVWSCHALYLTSTAIFQGPGLHLKKIPSSKHLDVAFVTVFSSFFQNFGFCGIFDCQSTLLFSTCPYVRETCNIFSIQGHIMKIARNVALKAHRHLSVYQVFFLNRFC